MPAVGEGAVVLGGHHQLDVEGRTHVPVDREGLGIVFVIRTGVAARGTGIEPGTDIGPGIGLVRALLNDLEQGLEAQLLARGVIARIQVAVVRIEIDGGGEGVEVGPGGEGPEKLVRPGMELDPGGDEFHRLSRSTTTVSGVTQRKSAAPKLPGSGWAWLSGRWVELAESA